MKTLILAGGKGNRLIEKTEKKPKAMVEIGGKPILIHIMEHYSHYGFNEFVIALGYKGEEIRNYLKKNKPINWEIELVDTGIETQTGGRIKRLGKYTNNKTFMLTWADGLSNINLNKLLAFHKSNGKIATLTAVHPPTRFGHLKLDGNKVSKFSEKQSFKEEWINGAFFVLEPEVLDYINGDNSYFEKETLEKLADNGKLMAYKHTSFWQCMDTIRDKMFLQELYSKGTPPWKDF